MKEKSPFNLRTKERKYLGISNMQDTKIKFYISPEKKVQTYGKAYILG